MAGGAEYNFRAIPAAQIDPAALPIEGHGLSAFAREDGTVYHTYSAYARGCDALWSMWQWLDRAPLGRNEGGYVVVPSPRRISGVILYCMLAGN